PGPVVTHPLLSFPTRRSSDLAARAFGLRDGAAAFESPRARRAPPGLFRATAAPAPAGGCRWWFSPRRRATTASPRRIFQSAIAEDRKSTRLNSSHVSISYAVF